MSTFFLSLGHIYNMYDPLIVFFMRTLFKILLFLVISFFVLGFLFVCYSVFAVM